MAANTNKPKPNGLKCEVCGKPLTGKQRRACGPEHRNQIRSRAGADRKLLAEEVAKHEVTEAVREEVVALAHEATQEAMSAELLTQIQRFVFLIPKALDAITTNLDDEDPDIRQKAATLLLKYTMGNASVAPPSLEQQDQPLQINFTIPRADTVGPAKGGGVRPLLTEVSDLSVQAPVIDVESTDLDDRNTCEKRTCMECGLEKCADEFIGQSYRCKHCDGLLRARVEGEFGHPQLG